MIYDYLFFKSYKLAKRSRNFDGSPVWGGVWGVFPCFVLNILSLMFLSDGLFKSKLSILTGFKVFKYFFILVIILGLLFYYLHNKRWEKIILKFSNREERYKIKIHPVIVLILAYIISFTLLLLAGMFKNGDGVFAPAG